MGDGRAEGSVAIGDREQAAVSLTPDIDGTNICIFECSKLEGSYVGDFIHIYIYVYTYIYLWFFYCIFLLFKRFQKEQKHLV